MIDFRYHLISLVAVLLALALGILVGSGFIGDPLLADIERRAERIQEENADLITRANELEGRLEDADEFAELAEPLLIEDQLREREVVLFVFDGTDGRLVTSVEDALTDAGATVATSITFLDTLEMTSTVTREQLALILRSTLSVPADLLTELGRELSSHAATAAASERVSPPVATRMQNLLDELVEGDFVSVASNTEELVPAGSMFVVLGGSNSPVRWDASILAGSLAGGLAQGAPVVVAEPSDSSWRFTSQLRQASEIAAVVSTVDHAESPAGRIALVLSLDRMRFGVVGHYGLGPGAGELLPEPATGN